MESLPYFLAIPSDPDYCLYKVLDDPTHVFFTALMNDLKSIETNQLNEFCEKHHIEFFVEKESNKDQARRIWYLTHHLRKAVALKRKEQLLLSPSNSYLENLKLNTLPTDSNGLVEMKNFSQFTHGLMYEDHVFQLCPSLSNFNSSYWLFDLILQAHYQYNVNFKIKLDPFIRVHKDEYSPVFHKMNVYGRTLDWNRIKNLKEEEHGQWLGDSFSNGTIEFTDYVWSPSKDEIHFTCEELPKIEYMEERGSRYFHAIFDIKSGVIIHCDGAMRYYTEEELNHRKQHHIRRSEVRKVGQRIKLFQVDEPISQALFMSLATTFLVWNMDALFYFNPENEQLQRMMELKEKRMTGSI